MRLVVILVVRSVRDWGAAGAAAFQLLTRLPVPAGLEYTVSLLRRSVVFYPLVGAVLGGLLLAGGVLAERLWSPAPAAVIVLALWVALTGALHLDGLMDTADGVLSHRSRERMLEIMKDSRVGAMGVVAGVLVLMLKASLLYQWLLGEEESALAWIVLVPLWSRAVVVWAVAGWPYARAEKGMGSLLAGVGRKEAVAATIVAWALTVLLAFISSERLPAEIGYALGLPVVAGAAGYWGARHLARKLGGLTGDTYGALNEGLETLLLAALLVLERFL